MSPLDPLDAALQQAALRTGRFVTAHSRGLTAVLVVGMVGFAATAFGIAPMAPDAADLPQRTVREAVTPDALEPQLEALAAHGLSLYRSEVTRSGDTVDSLLRRLSIVDASAAAFLRNDPAARALFTGRTGKQVQARTDARGRLEELVARYAPDDSALFDTHFTRLTVRRHGDALQATSELARLQPQMRLGSGTIRQSLFAATDEARIPDTVASQVAEIFSADIDFHRELRRGDTFSVVYEALTADGEPVRWNQGAGRVLAAEFVNDGSVHTAVWFEDRGAGGKGAYYDMNGQNKRRSFLASPLEFSRVTSGFAMRLHPILGTWRQHNGIDYGAPTGTPVRSVGDGVVEFAGRQGGYGNVVKVRHSNDRTTVYAHLSRIDVRNGARIEQGQRIGAVGATGWATGPHLHFEFMVRGAHVNPIAVAQSSETAVVSAAAMPAFRRWSGGVRAQLDAAQTAAQRGDYAE
ncbi:M23 family metallopeptidase [Piscinibacter sakaiensis]|uniref:M23 family metallopeptidase n=1 Tax=Piscinibacter sakaiensis TaxID=1547922 RepID=UPI001E3BF038|nr:M23 family metallopeptidase [Piscinibacter sakaiensis]